MERFVKSIRHECTDQLILFGERSLQRELSELIDRQVDLRTPGDLSRYFRAKVMREAIEQFAA